MSIKGIPQSVVTSNLNTLLQIQQQLSNAQSQITTLKSMLTSDWGDLNNIDPLIWDQSANNLFNISVDIRDLTYHVDNELKQMSDRGDYEEELLEEQVLKLKQQEAEAKLKAKAREQVFGPVEATDLG